MNCPKCFGSKNIKSGRVNGLQRYKCKHCGCNYTKSNKRGYPNSVKLKAVNLYLEGCGFRRIERLMGISNVTVMKWVRQLGEKVSELRNAEKSHQIIELVELDELFTYVYKKTKDISCGWLLIEIPKRYWRSKSAIAVKQV